MKIHIPTEQYGFIETEVETVLEAKELSDEVKFAFENKSGLSDKEFNKALDRYLTDGTGETETYLAMNRKQQDIIQAIKRSMARLSSKDE